MAKRVLGVLVVLGIIAAAILWFLTEPTELDAGQLPAHTPDIANGARMFAIGGCVSCHAAPGAKADGRLLLGGGLRLVTEFGTFVAPNISPDPQAGIGRWSMVDFANALLNGVSPEGEHYYPAFPYTSYARMKIADVIDLKGYMDTLPPVSRASEPHELGFPFTVRRGLGLWKLLYVDSAPVLMPAQMTPELGLGRYLVEGPGHCAECHTPRDLLGGLDKSRWFAGAPNPDGPGTIPNITPHETGIGGWSVSEIAYYLKTGFRPDFDTVGGAMVEVIKNTTLLSDAERTAIALYLKAVKPTPKTLRDGKK